MQIGITLPQMGDTAGPEAMRLVSGAADELGFAGVWVGDHIVLPRDHVTDYPFSSSGAFPFPGAVPWFEAFTSLTYVAAFTSRVRLGISVCVVPYRPAALLAKIVASLDQLSGGRVTLGVGAGWLEREFDALNAPYAGRGAATDEALGLLRAAWTRDGPVTYHGDHVSVEDCFFSPRPRQPDGIPIWVGGSGAAARRRSLEFGAAWHPHILKHSPDAIRAEMDKLSTHASKLGRPAPAVALYAPIELDAEPTSVPWEAGVVRGSADQIVAALGDYEAAGVQEFVVTMRGVAARDASTKAEHMARLAAAW
jgi:probable F420-dependent oxidoreductase